VAVGATRAARNIAESTATIMSQSQLPVQCDARLSSPADANQGELPLGDILTRICIPKAPPSFEDCRPNTAGDGRPTTAGRSRPGTANRNSSRESGVEGAIARQSSDVAFRPTSARGSSRPLSARGGGSGCPSPRQQGGALHSTRGANPSSAQFFSHVAQGAMFSPRIGFLEPKVIGNGSQWDADRLLMPERAFPCGGSDLAANFHDNNAERKNRPAWKPTTQNQRTGMGDRFGEAFPLPPMPSRPRSGSARPRSAKRVSDAPVEKCPAREAVSRAAAAAGGC